MRSSIPNSVRTGSASSNGDAAQPAPGSARGQTVYDEPPCEPEEVLCIQLR